MASGGIPTIHPNPAKPDTGLAIACLAAILLILPILSIHVESSSPMDEQDRQDQWSGWVQPLTPNEECLFRRRSVPPPSRLGAGGDPEPWADAHGYLLPPLRGCLWNLSQASTFQMFHPRMIRPGSTDWGGWRGIDGGPEGHGATPYNSRRLVLGVDFDLKQTWVRVTENRFNRFQRKGDPMERN